MHGASPLNECMYSMRGRGKLSGCICACWRKYEPTTANTVWKKKKKNNTLYNVCCVFSPRQSAPSGSQVHSPSTFSEPHASISPVSKLLRNEKRAVLDLFGLLCFWTVFWNRPFLRSKTALIPHLPTRILQPLRLPCFMTYSKHMKVPTKNPFLAGMGKFISKGGCKHRAKYFLS